MLGGDGCEGHAHQRVGARGEHIQRVVFAVQFIREAHPHAFALADPVRLHRAHALRPIGERVQRIEQILRVIRDAQVVHRDLALLDDRTGAPAFTVDHLLVREHGLIDRIPIDHARLLVRDALFEHAQEQPLIPVVVLGLTGGELTRPVERKAERLELALHVRDVVVGPFRRRHAVRDRRVLGRQAERIPPHRLQDVVALLAHEARNHIADRVVAHMPHVQPPAGIREHAQAVILGPPRILADGESLGLFPMGTGLRLDGSRIVSFLHEGKLRRKSGLFEAAKDSTSPLAAESGPPWPKADEDSHGGRTWGARGFEQTPHGSSGRSTRATLDSYAGCDPVTASRTLYLLLSR